MHARDELKPFASDRDRLWRAARLACDRSAIQRAIERDKGVRCDLEPLLRDLAPDLRGVFVTGCASALRARPHAKPAAVVVPALEQTAGRAVAEPAGLSAVASPCGRPR